MLLIFDCDGVLIDSERLAARACADALAICGVTLSPAEIGERFTGLSFTAMVRQINDMTGAELGEDFARLNRDFLHEAFIRELKPVSGVAAVLAALPGPRCVASSSDLERLDLTLGLTGLTPVFAPHIFSATMVARGKPAPDLFLHAARVMAHDPRDCLVIEDSVAGVRAGVAAGMRVVGFTGASHCGPGHGASLSRAGAHLIVGAMPELPAALAALGG